MSGGYTHITLAQLTIEEVSYCGEGLLYADTKLALSY